MQVVVGVGALTLEEQLRREELLMADEMSTRQQVVAGGSPDSTSDDADTTTTVDIEKKVMQEINVVFKNPMVDLPDAIESRDAQQPAEVENPVAAAAADDGEETK